MLGVLGVFALYVMGRGGVLPFVGSAVAWGGAAAVVLRRSGGLAGTLGIAGRAGLTRTAGPPLRRAEAAAWA